jgi:hypothetical protein
MIKQLFVLLTTAVLGLYQLPKPQDDTINKTLEAIGLTENTPNHEFLPSLSYQSLDELMCQYFNVSKKELKRMKTGTEKWPNSKGGLVKLPDNYLLENKRNEINESRLLEPVALAFQEMADSAKKEGIQILLGSGYRSKQEQAIIYARSNGSNTVAAPGGSNHQKGFATDIASHGDFIKYGQTYKWLNKNASKYGFENPSWAKGDNGPREQWHWEYGPSRMKEWYSEQIQTRKYHSEMQRSLNKFYSTTSSDELDTR